jgi:diguanylate cyclase (GGDEF)-like protein
MSLRTVAARSQLGMVWLHSYATLAVAGFLWSQFMVGSDPIADSVEIPWWVVSVGFLIAESWIVHMHFRSESGSFSFFEIPLIIGVLFVDPGMLVPAVVIGTLTSQVLHKRPPVKTGFNVANFCFYISLSWVLLDRLAANHDALEPVGWIAVLAACLMASLAQLFNIWLVVSMSERNFQIPNLLQMFLFGSVVSLSNSVQALVMSLLLTIEPWSLVLLGFSTAVLFVSYRSYVSERDQRERVEFLYSSTRALKSADEVDTATASLVEEAAAMFRAGYVEIQLPWSNAKLEGADESGRVLRWNDGVADLELMTPRQHEEIRMLATAASTPVIVDFEGGPLAGFAKERGFQDAMVGALASGEGRTGLIVVANRLGSVATFGSEDLQLFATLVQHAALALENDQLEHALTQLRSLERELAHQASHDTLTGLPNRALLGRHLVEQLDTADSLSLLYVDLDDFKLVNDTMGHAAGDQVLVEAARRLHTCIRPTDVAARLGGDEFAVLLIGNEHPLKTAERIVESLSAPYDVDEDQIATIGASAGLATSHAGDDAVTLLSQADVAMYTAKEQGKGNVAVFEPSMHARASEQQILRTQLRSAVADEQFQVVYQPIVELSTGRIVAAEALVRWVSPEGLLLPHGFIGEAERSGLIVPIDSFVFSQVLTDFTEIDDRGHTDLWVTSNLSMRTLQEPDLVQRISENVAAADVSIQRLVLEVTETALMRDPEVATRQLNVLRESGLRVALDDFGTGYSSLSYLRRFPVDILKIAQPFTVDLDEDDDTFVRAMTDLGHTLGLTVLAEGIETRRALDSLRNLRVDLGQGYIFARPLPLEELLVSLDEQVRSGPKHPAPTLAHLDTRF